MIEKDGPEGLWYYEYDPSNRLVGVEGPALSADYGYDGFVQRVLSDVNGVQTRFVIDPIGFGNLIT